MIQYHNSPITYRTGYRVNSYEQPIPAVLDVEQNQQPVIHNNHIYFWSDINQETALWLVDALHQVNGDLRGRGYSEIPITLHVMSNGGDLFAALAVVDQYKTLDSKVLAVAEGVCYSAGTVLVIGAERSFAQRHTLMLVHPISGGIQGDHTTITQYTDSLDTSKEMLVDFYLRNSIATRDRVLELMERDSYLTAEEAKAAGLIEAVI